MCGRYYIDDETETEIIKIIRQVDETLKQERTASTRKTGEIFPTNAAPVITNSNDHPIIKYQSWGFPNFNKKGVIINARAETALEKKTFRNSLLSRRCVIPAKHFYEWDHNKNKCQDNTKIEFSISNHPVLYMAGLYNLYNDTECFVILTTAANLSIQDVHDRMPLILNPDEIEDWLYDDERLPLFLNKIPQPLQRNIENEQLKLNI